MDQQRGREKVEVQGRLIHKISLHQAPAYAGAQGHGVVGFGQVVFQEFEFEGRRGGEQQYGRQRGRDYFDGYRLSQQRLARPAQEQLISCQPGSFGLVAQPERPAAGRQL